jgi:hypothetical protein
VRISVKIRLDTSAGGSSAEVSPSVHSLRFHPDVIRVVGECLALMVRDTNSEGNESLTSIIVTSEIRRGDTD